MSETIEQKAQKPPGLIPKQVQNYVILGVATVLIVIIWLTSGSDKKPANQSRLQAIRGFLPPQPGKA